MSDNVSERAWVTPPMNHAASARSGPLRRWLLLASVCLIVYVSLFPFIGWRSATGGWWLFNGAAYHHVLVADTLANVLLYVPPGLLLALGRRRRVILVAVLAALALSVGMETAQAFIPGRVSSPLDVISNGFGAGLGAVVAPLLRWPRRMLARDVLARLRHDRVAWLGIAALVAWGCAQLIPFLPSLQVGALKHGLKPLWYALHGAGAFSLWRCLVYVAATAALTVTGASALRISRWGLVTAALLLVILPLKVLVIDRQLSTQALFGTLAGVAIGLLLWASNRQRALIIAAILVPACIVAAALQPGPAGALTHPFNWVPLHAQLTHPLNGAANLADAVWPWLAVPCLCLRLKVRALWQLLPCVALLLFGIEWAQRAIPGRYPDITTVMVGVATWVAAAAYAGTRQQLHNDT